MVRVIAVLLAVLVLAAIPGSGSPARARLGAGGAVSRAGASRSRSDAVGALDAVVSVPSPGFERGALPQPDDATGPGLDPDKVERPMVVPAAHVPVLRELVDRWSAALDAGDDAARSRAAAELVGAVEYLLNQH